MAEEVERHHQDDGIDGQAGVAAQDLANRNLGRALSRVPVRALGHVPADIDDEQRRQRTDDEQSTPADVWEQHAIGDGGEKIAARIARLQQPRYPAAPLGRNRLHRQR
jgi:hypothetical protein